MAISLPRKLSLGFMLALVVLIAIGTTSYRGVREMQDADARERQSKEVLAAVSALNERMAEAEAGQRGYLITGDPHYLSLYNRALLSLPGTEAHLSATVHPDDAPRVPHVVALLQRKQAELAATIAAWNVGDRAAATAVVSSASSRALTDSVRAELGVLRQAEQGRLDDRQAIARMDADKVGLVITLGVLVAVAIAAFALAMVAHDDRNRERDRQALERARDAAEAASRAKSDFLARMSHELRTPLNAIIGFAGVLLRNKRGALNEQDLGFLTRIQASGTQLLTIINDILDLSKIEAGRMDVNTAPVDLLGLIRETVDSFVGAIDRSEVALALDLPNTLNPLMTDVDKLRQVISNLLANAIKFTERGRVVVRVIADSSGSRAWRLDVIDEGTGVAPTRQAAIFGAFEQAENSITRRYGGTGLGLAISKSICERLGFGLAVVSQEGQGSTFSILFDSAAKPPLRHERPSGSSPVVGGIESVAASPSTAERNYDVGPSLPWNTRVSGR